MPRVRLYGPDERLNQMAGCNLAGRIECVISQLRDGSDKRLVLRELYMLQEFVGVPIENRPGRR